MKHLPSPPLRILALTGLLSLSAVVLPAQAHGIEQRNNDPCATAVGDSSSAAAASGSGAQVSTDSSANDRHRARASSCSGVNCVPSSSVTAGTGSVSGSSNMPGGSSVTVHSRDGVVSSSSVTSATSGGSGETQGTSSAGTGRDAECAVISETRSKDAERNERDRNPEEQRRH
jgi:hypothetical protein